MADQEAIYDLDTYVAGLRALVDLLSTRVETNVTRTGVEVPPAVLAAYNALGDGLERASRIEARMRGKTSIPVDLVKAYVTRVSQVLQRFVPTEKLDSAIRAFRNIDRPRAEVEFEDNE